MGRATCRHKHSEVPVAAGVFFLKNTSICVALQPRRELVNRYLFNESYLRILDRLVNLLARHVVVIYSTDDRT